MLFHPVEVAKRTPSLISSSKNISGGQIGLNLEKDRFIPLKDRQ